jgi:hypothetical protein
MTAREWTIALIAAFVGGLASRMIEEIKKRRTQ